MVTQLNFDKGRLTTDDDTFLLQLKPQTARHAFLQQEMIKMKNTPRTTVPKEEYKIQ